MLLIGAAGDRRTALLRSAAARHGVPIEIVDWCDLVVEESLLEERVARAYRAGHRWCKIDPPPAGPVSDALVCRGWRASTAESPPPAAVRHGELGHRHWWYAGLAALLNRCTRVLEPLRLLNPIASILLMCDKWECQRHLHGHGIAAPELLGEVRSLDELEDRYPVRTHPAVFVKARFGSSAAGVIAMRRHPDGRIVAYASARLEDGAIYNHLRITRYHERSEIRALIAALARQGAYAERWIPKPRPPVAGATAYDLRVVAFCGKARQRIGRLSRSPLTNLHLGNARAAPDWLEASQLCRLDDAIARAASCFGASCSIGFDVSLTNDRVHVFEANAFGDLLPNLEYEGSTTHGDQIELVAADEC